MEFLEDLWEGIKRRKTKSKDQDDFDGIMMGMHAILGLVGTIIIAINTPLGLYAIGTIIATIILALFWNAADIHDNLAIGYFFAGSFFSFAWVLYLPIALIVFIFGFPIFLSQAKKKK